MADLAIIKGQTSIEKECIGDTLVLKISSERIDTTNAVDFRLLLESVMTVDFKNYILDFSKVEIIDSSGFSMLIILLKKLSPEKKMYFACLNPEILNAFNLLKLDALFKFYSTCEEALQSF